MNSIIPVTIDIETKEQLVNGRDLHEGLGSKRQFSDWIKQRIDKYGFVDGEDFTVHKFVNGKTVQIDYILTLDMAKELAMVDGSEKGREVRRYFINCEKELKEMHFKALEIFTSKNRLYTMTDFSNICNIEGLGRDKMFKWAERKEFIYKKFGDWTPYRRYIDKEYFEVKEKWNEKANKFIKTLMITPKGAVWLHKKLREDGYNPKSLCEVLLENKAEESKLAFGMTPEQRRTMRG